MKALVLAAALAVLGTAAYAADPSGGVSIEVVPATAPPPPPTTGAVPPQATAQGFGTLAFDGDMTKGFDVSCNNPATEDHQWYIGGHGVLSASCKNLTYPHVDETDGSRVLDINFGPSSQNGALLARVGISTSDDRGAHSHNFPINAYYECSVRFDAYSIGHMPLWNNCWMVSVNDAVSGVGGGMEWDLTEFHGGYQDYTEVAGNINWACGGPGACSPFNWFGNLATKISGYDPSKFHKYGMLVNQTDANTVHIAGYVDDVLIKEGTTPISVKNQRNYLVVSLNGACNWDEGGVSYCSNQPIQNVYADGNGNTHIQTTNATMSSGFAIGITGVSGVPINGNFGFKQDNWLGGANGNFGCNGPCTLSILDKPNGSPVKFSGKYTGGGMVNKWDDPGMHAYVKSFKVWSCAAWANTQCSKFNPN